MVSLRQALREGCADNYNCAGTAAEFLALTHALEVAGYSCWHGSSLELGVGQVSCLHATAAARACTMASDFQSGLIRSHTLITWDWPYQDGKLPLPIGPGLGIELDRDALIRHRRAHEIFTS
jgi:muconate cycloisomerase